MERHSRALSGVLATVLGLALTACGGSGDRNESGGRPTGHIGAAARGILDPWQTGGWE